MAELLLKDEVYAIVGAAMEVYNQLGPGFLEPIYQEAMEIETVERNIPTEPQQKIVVLYKGKRLKKLYIADLLCYDQMIVEIKAIDSVIPRRIAIDKLFEGNRIESWPANQLRLSWQTRMATIGSNKRWLQSQATTLFARR